MFHIAASTELPLFGSRGVRSLQLPLRPPRRLPGASTTTTPQLPLLPLLLSRASPPAPPPARAADRSPSPDLELEIVVTSLPAADKTFTCLRAVEPLSCLQAVEPEDSQDDPEDIHVLASFLCLAQEAGRSRSRSRSRSHSYGGERRSCRR